MRWRVKPHNGCIINKPLWTESTIVFMRTESPLLFYDEI